MKKWTGNIAIKSNGKINDSQWNEIKQWPEVASVWSTTGQWDWLVQLKPADNSIEAAESTVWNLRKLPWVAETTTWWSKEW